MAKQRILRCLHRKSPNAWSEMMLDFGGRVFQAIDQLNGFLVSFYNADMSLFPSKIPNVFVADTKHLLSHFLFSGQGVGPR